MFALMYIISVLGNISMPAVLLTKKCSSHILFAFVSLKKCNRLCIMSSYHFISASLRFKKNECRIK